MAGATFQIPLITVIPGQLITAALWNNEWVNVAINLNPTGMDGYEDTDAQMQIQTNPYPGGVTSHATSLGGEIERIRYQISQILGPTTPPYWYAAIPVSLTTLSNTNVPIGGVIDYPVTPVPSNFTLCNGAAISRTVYSALFTLIGTTFGIGDGSTTFNIPNYTDRLSITAGNLYSVGATGGASTHTIATSELPTAPVSVSITDPGHNHTQNAHNHVASDSGHVHIEQGNTYVGSNGAPPNTIPISGGNSNIIPGKQTATASADSQNTATQAGTAVISVNNTTATNISNTTGITASGTVSGGGGAMNILNPYIGMYKIIRII